MPSSNLRERSVSGGNDDEDNRGRTEAKAGREKAQII